jgi:hypothetical protein
MKNPCYGEIKKLLKKEDLDDTYKLFIKHLID